MEIDSKKKTVKQHKNEVKALGQNQESQTQDLLRQLEKKKKTILELTSSLNQEKFRCNAKTFEYERLSEEKKDLLLKIQELEKQNYALSASTKQCVASSQHMRMQITKLQDLNEDLMTQNSQLDLKIKATENEKVGKEKLVDRLQHEVVKFKIEKEEIASLNRALEEKVAKAAKTEMVLLEANQKLVDIITSYRQDVEKLRQLRRNSEKETLLIKEENQQLKLKVQDVKEGGLLVHSHESKWARNQESVKRKGRENQTLSTERKRQIQDFENDLAVMRQECVPFGYNLWEDIPLPENIFE